VWGEMVETETAQDVYVYVKVVGENGQDGELTDEELAKVREWGLTTLNKDGYFTIGKVQGCMLPDIYEYGATDNIIDEYGDAVNINKIERHEDNAAVTLDDMTWYTLHWADGATDYVPTGTRAWHMDGYISINDLEERLVTVTYTDGVDDAVVFDDQARRVIPG